MKKHGSDGSVFLPSPVCTQVLSDLRKQTGGTVLPQTRLGPLLCGTLQLSVPDLLSTGDGKITLKCFQNYIFSE